MKLAPAIPILRIFSEDKAREFYLDFLGFTLEWEHRFEENFPLYAQISRSGLTLHLSEHHGDATPGSTVFAPARISMHCKANSLRRITGTRNPVWKTFPGAA